MNVWDGKHWNIYDILPYQRMFNMINSERTIGKTYTGQAYCIDRAINNGEEWVYVCRTETERENYILGAATEKVRAEKFESYDFNVNKDNITLDGQIIARCIPLSKVDAYKKLNFPSVRNMIFDEYIIPPDSTAQYIGGMREPNLLLNLYHTIDRAHDRVRCFMFGNTIQFYNPYHLHKAFTVPKIDVGQIWTNKFILFQRPEMSDKLREEQNNSLFMQMISDTEYGTYANAGEYAYENENFINNLPSNVVYFATLCYNDKLYGIWNDNIKGILYISSRCEKSYLIKLALSNNDLANNIMLAKNSAHGKYLRRYLQQGRIYYDSAEIKAELEKIIFKNFS